jgi:hypothetical protein
MEKKQLQNCLIARNLRAQKKQEEKYSKIDSISIPESRKRERIFRHRFNPRFGRRR